MGPPFLSPLTPLAGWAGRTHIPGPAKLDLPIQRGVLKLLDLGVDLEAVACRFQDEDPPCRIDVHRYRSPEAPLWLQIHSPARLEDVSDKVILTALALRHLGLTGLDGKAGAHMSGPELKQLHGIIADMVAFHDTQCSDPECQFRGSGAPDGKTTDTSDDTDAGSTAMLRAARRAAQQRQLALIRARAQGG